MSNIKRSRGVGIADTTLHTFTLPGTGGLVKAEDFSPPAGERNRVTDGEDYGRGIDKNLCVTDYPEQGGSMLMKLRQEDEIFIRLLNGILGKANYAYSVDTPVAGANTHDFGLEKVLETLAYYSIAVDFPDSTIRGFTSATPTQIMIELADGIFKANVTFIGDFWGVQTGPMTLTSSTGDIGCFRLVDGEAKVRVNGFSAGALDAAAEQTSASNIRIEINRGVLSLDPTQGGGPGRSDFVDNTQPEIFLEIEYPKAYTQNLGYLEGHQTPLYYKADVSMLGAIITGSTPYEFTMNFPRLQVVDPPTHDEATPMPTTVRFKVLEADTSPTGMTGVLPYGYLVNTLTDIGY